MRRNGVDVVEAGAVEFIKFNGPRRLITGEQV